MHKSSFYRILDIFLCLVLFIPITIFLAILASLILLIDGRPLFFIHKRIGKTGKEFLVYKFKTYPPVQKTEDDIVVDHLRAERTVSVLGRVYRDHGWDELPQVLNILLGQMSFVGPRPLVRNTYEDLKKRYPDKIELIELWKKERLSVLPGLSGWHQIHLHDPNVIEHDLDFVRNPSFFRYLHVCLTSIGILVFGKSRILGEKIPTSNQYEINDKI